MTEKVTLLCFLSKVVKLGKFFILISRKFNHYIMHISNCFMFESMSDINHHDEKSNDDGIEGKDIGKAFNALF